MIWQEIISVLAQAGFTIERWVYSVTSEDGTTFQKMVAYVSSNKLDPVPQPIPGNSPFGSVAAVVFNIQRLGPKQWRIEFAIWSI